MSSLSMSGSGQRSLSMTVNNQEMTGSSMPTKPDDNVSISLGSVFDLRMIVPTNARLERIKSKDGKSEYLRLVVPGSASLQLFGGIPLDPEMDRGSAWPHANVGVGKHLTDYYAAYEVVDVVHARVGDLIPPTETEE